MVTEYSTPRHTLPVWQKWKTRYDTDIGRVEGFTYFSTEPFALVIVRYQTPKDHCHYLEACIRAVHYGGIR